MTPRLGVIVALVGLAIVVLCAAGVAPGSDAQAALTWMGGVVGALVAITGVGMVGFAAAMERLNLTTGHEFGELGDDEE